MKRILFTLCVFTLCVFTLFSCSVSTGGSSCGDLNFESCGGDITGKWNMKNICENVEQSYAEVYQDPQCLNGGIESSSIDWQNSYYEFKSDGTYTFYIHPFFSDVHYILHEECLAAVAEKEGKTGEEYCMDIKDDYSTCEYTEPDCICNMDIENVEGSTEPGNYTTTDEGILTLDRYSNEFMEDEVARYCVKGSQLIIEFKSGNENIDPSYYILQK